MKVLDLFYGLGGFSQAFKERGHEIVTVDIEEKFNPTICKDVLELTIEDLKSYMPFDVVLASPPCTCFSIASISTHWNPNRRPKETAKHAIAIVKKTLQLIEYLNPKFWIVENPRGMLRKMSFMKVYHHKLITLCQYGDTRMKPTDLWGKFPMVFSARRCYNNDNCHESAPRGSKTGTQGLPTSAERAKLPYGLSKELCSACENPSIYNVWLTAEGEQ